MWKISGVAKIALTPPWYRVPLGAKQSGPVSELIVVTTQETLSDGPSSLCQEDLQCLPPNVAGCFSCFPNGDLLEPTVTHLEPDILECEVKWVLESITTNEASGGDGIPVELF